MRLVGLFLLLAIVVIVPFVIWGDGLEAMFSGEAWVERWGAWLWLAGVVLLAADLFLPIPGTAVMAGLGLAYGPVWGGLLSAAGSILGGLIGYGLCRAMGEKVALRLLGERDLVRGKALFASVGGGGLVAFSRWLPVIPEVVSCAAGLVRMPFPRFALALVCGSVPLGFAYAWFGAVGKGQPVVALAVSCVLPPLLWWGIGRWLVRRAEEGRGCE